MNTTRRLAPLPLAVLTVCVAAAVALFVLTGVTDDVRPDAPVGPVVNLLVVVLLTWSVFGALVASRHPENPVGWLFLVGGVIFSVGPFCDAYLAAVGGAGELLPGRAYAGWVTHVLLNSSATFGLFALILLLFPSGRPPSPRWRPIVVATVCAMAVFTLLLSLRPGPLTEVEPPADNPFGVAAVATPWQIAELPLFLVFVGGCIAGVASVVVRFRRSSGIERQQLKWFIAGAVGLVAVGATGPALFWQVEALESYWPFAFIPALTLPPLTAGFAMLRYRLYDIDRIVSRTASYAIVVAVLATSYAGLTLVLSSALRPVTGEGDLPVALSTLAVAAAGRPLLARVRGVVERRFNRRRYDAARAVAQFGHKLRDEFDGLAIGGAMTALVQTTFEPRLVSLWETRRPHGPGPTRHRDTPVDASTENALVRKHAPHDVDVNAG